MANDFPSISRIIARSYPEQRTGLQSLLGSGQRKDLSTPEGAVAASTASARADVGAVVTRLDAGPRTDSRHQALSRTRDLVFAQEFTPLSVLDILA